MFKPHLAPDQHCCNRGLHVGEGDELGDEKEADLEETEGEEAGNNGLVPPSEYPCKAYNDRARAGDVEDEVGGLRPGALLVVQHAGQVKVGKISACLRTKPVRDI